MGRGDAREVHKLGREMVLAGNAAQEAEFLFDSWQALEVCGAWQREVRSGLRVEDLAELTVLVRVEQDRE